MIRLCFFERDGVICGFDCEGHSGYGEKGTDIICAAVSAAVELVESTINDIGKAGAAVAVDKNKTHIRLMLPDKMTNKTRLVSESVLRAMYQTLSGYAEEYGKYLSISKRKVGSEYKNGG